MIVRLRQDLEESAVPYRLIRKRLYVVLCIEADDYRLLDDDDDPILLDSELFEIVDPKHPSDWKSSRGDGGQLYAGPASLPHHDWEDYQERASVAQRKIREYLSAIAPCSWTRTDRVANALYVIFNVMVISAFPIGIIGLPLAKAEIQPWQRYY